MSLGTPELLMIILLATLFVLPIVAIVFAAIDEAWKWLVALIVTTPFALGWILAIVYLSRRRSRVTTVSTLATFPTGPPSRPNAAAVRRVNSLNFTCIGRSPSCDITAPSPQYSKATSDFLRLTHR